ncbi:hypothetical protein CR513_08942, partial [Mucuna pruriens]
LYQPKPKPKPSRIDLYRDHLGSVSAESNSAIAEYLMLVEMTKHEPYQIGAVAGIQVLLCFRVPKPGQMENNDRTLKELATLDLVYQPWCIQYPQLEPAQTYELKSDLIHLLPKFHGLAGEDPHKHLKEFHVVCSTMRPQGISEDYIKYEGVPLLPGQSSEGFAVSSANTFQHLGRYEADIPGKVLSGIQNCVHQKEDMWDKAAYRRNFA